MDKSKLTFIKAQQNDIEYLLSLRMNTMNEHLINSGMDIDIKNHTQRINYQWDSANIILLNDCRIGMLKISEDDANIEIIQIQIEPEYQNCGTRHPYGRWRPFLPATRRADHAGQFARQTLHTRAPVSGTA